MTMRQRLMKVELEAERLEKEIREKLRVASIRIDMLKNRLSDLTKVRKILRKGDLRAAEESLDAND